MTYLFNDVNEYEMRLNWAYRLAFEEAAGRLYRKDALCHYCDRLDDFNDVISSDVEIKDEELAQHSDNIFKIRELRERYRILYDALKELIEYYDD